MVPMNLLGPGRWADYIVNGAWGEKAIKEAKKVGAVNLAHTTGPDFKRVSKQDELKLTPGAAYVHMTSNETIQGVEYTGSFETGERAARLRHLVRHVRRPDRRLEVRLHLRRRAEEHGAGRRDAGHHPRGPGGEGAGDPPVDDALRRRC
jgi:hypothetical protein